MAESKEAAQAAKTVRFTRTDGRTPTRQGPARSFNLLAPIDVVIQPGEVVSVDLGLSCDHPVHVFPSRGVTASGVVLVDGIWAATDADVPLVLRMLNTTRQEMVLSEGEVLARCHVMDDAGWELG